MNTYITAKMAAYDGLPYMHRNYQPDSSEWESIGLSCGIYLSLKVAVIHLLNFD